MKNIQIIDSYRIWKTSAMKNFIQFSCGVKYRSLYPEELLNRSYQSMYIEWWLHNIGYYLTKPLCGIDPIRKINLRCKDVDIEEHKKGN